MKLTRDQWIRANRECGFFDPLNLAFYDKRLSKRPFRLQPPPLTYITRKGEKITVPVGYRSDFASIPRFFQRIFQPVGKHGKAAWVHDWLCEPDSGFPFGFWEAAGIFGEAMELLGVHPVTRFCMVAAVRIGGPRFKAAKIIFR